MARRRRHSGEVVPILLHSVSSGVGCLWIDLEAVAEDAAKYLGAANLADLPAADQNLIRRMIKSGHMKSEYIMAAKEASDRLRDVIELGLAAAGFPHPPTRRLADDAQRARDILLRRPGGVLDLIERHLKLLRAATNGRRGPVPARVPSGLAEYVEQNSPRIELEVRQFRSRIRSLDAEERHEPAERFLKDLLRGTPTTAKLSALRNALASTTRRPSEIVDAVLAWEWDPSGGSRLRRQIMAIRRSVRRQARP